MAVYALIPKHLSYETIDNETIVIDLEKGHYYSLERTASIIWNFLESGVSVDKVLKLFSSICKNAPEEIQEFLDALSDEGLLTYLEKENNQVDQGFQPTVVEYQKPCFEKFEDMKDLLLLDPIHETDESGWPHQPVKEMINQ